MCIEDRIKRAADEPKGDFEWLKDEGNEMTKSATKEEKMEDGSKLNRVHISYPDKVKNRIEEIRQETNSSSVSDVFKQAVLFYALAFEEHKKGNDLIIRTKDGSTERLRMFM